MVSMFLSVIYCVVFFVLMGSGVQGCACDSCSSPQQLGAGDYWSTSYTCAPSQSVQVNSLVAQASSGTFHFYLMDAANYQLYQQNDSAYSTPRTGPYESCVSYDNSQTLDTNAVNIVIDTNDGITYALGYDMACVNQATTTCASGCAFSTINDENYVCPSCNGNNYNGGSCTCSDGSQCLVCAVSGAMASGASSATGTNTGGGNNWTSSSSSGSGSNYNCLEDGCEWQPSDGSIQYSWTCPLTNPCVAPTVTSGVCYCPDGSVCRDCNGRAPTSTSGSGSTSDSCSQRQTECNTQCMGSQQLFSCNEDGGIVQSSCQCVHTNGVGSAFHSTFLCTIVVSIIMLL